MRGLKKSAQAYATRLQGRNGIEEFAEVRAYWCLNPRPLVRLTDLINWDRLNTVMSESFVSRKERPATSPTLIAGLLQLRHAFDLTDEEVVWQWVDNPCWSVSNRR